MSFKVSRQRMFYAGATLSASAAIGFGILRAQDYGLKHPHALEVWIAICVIAAVVLAIVGAMSNEESSAPKATNTAQTIHGDGSPAALATNGGKSAGRDFVENQPVDNSTALTGNNNSGFQPVGSKIDVGGHLIGSLILPPSPQPTIEKKQLRKLKIIKADSTVAVEDGTL